jgi:hypothetical protein
MAHCPLAKARAPGRGMKGGDSVGLAFLLRIYYHASLSDSAYIYSFLDPFIDTIIPHSFIHSCSFSSIHSANSYAWREIVHGGSKILQQSHVFLHSFTLFLISPSPNPSTQRNTDLGLGGSR